jgi:hypothetical protein
MSLPRVIVTILALLLVLPLAADEPKRLHSVDDLAWMAGSWSGEGLGGDVEEHWSTPHGGTMIGMFRLVGADDKTKVSEFMMVEQEQSGVKYRFRHYGAGHETWEPDAPLEFDLVESGEGSAVFDSATQKKPKRLTYRLESGNNLSITVQNETDGELESGFTLQLTRKDDD